MIIIYRQEFFQALADPFHAFESLAFGTMSVPAGVIFYLLISALFAFILVMSQVRCAALYDGVCYFMLQGREFVFLQIGTEKTSEYFSYLMLGPPGSGIIKMMYIILCIVFICLHF